MKHSHLIFLFLLGVTQISCSQKTISPEEWLQKNTIDLQPKESYDFSKLKEVLKDKRIVALGESSHGLGNFYELKSALVMYLHDELDYEVIAMEGGLGDINLAYADIDTMSSKNLRDYTLFGNFKAKEVDALFNYIKNTSSSNTPLVYNGYDTQFSSSYFITKLTRLLKPLNKEMADSLSNRMYSFQKSFQAARSNDSIGYIKHRNIYIKNAKEISALLKTKKESLLTTKMLSREEYLVIQRSLEMFVRSTNLSYENRFNTYQLRDELMAENLEWLIDEVFPDKKIIIWAHNAHIQKGPGEKSNFKSMGQFLKEKYTSNYYSLGLFAYEGNTYQHWTGETIPFKNDDTIAIEKRFFGLDKTVPFLDISEANTETYPNWIFNEVTGFELENGGAIPFIPVNRFDGIISLKKSDIPTYDSHN